MLNANLNQCGLSIKPRGAGLKPARVGLLEVSTGWDKPWIGNVRLSLATVCRVVKYYNCSFCQSWRMRNVDAVSAWEVLTSDRDRAELIALCQYVDVPNKQATVMNNNTIILLANRNLITAKKTYATTSSQQGVYVRWTMLQQMITIRRNNVTACS